MRALKRPLWPAILLACLLGCKAGREILPSLPSDPASHGYQMVEGVSLPQGDSRFYCGPEVITAVLRFHKDPITFEQAVQALYDPQRQGTLSLDMVKFARGRGFDAKLAKGTISDVEEEVAAGRPVIILLDLSKLPDTWQLPFQTSTMFHYFVVVGVNVADRVLVAEGYGSTKQLLKYTMLDPAWTPAGHYLLTVQKK